MATYEINHKSIPDVASQDLRPSRADKMPPARHESNNTIEPFARSTSWADEEEEANTDHLPPAYTRSDVSSCNQCGKCYNCCCANDCHGCDICEPGKNHSIDDSDYEKNASCGKKCTGCRVCFID